MAPDGKDERFFARRRSASCAATARFDDLFHRGLFGNGELPESCRENRAKEEIPE
jgi:hypothetical protein